MKQGLQLKFSQNLSLTPQLQQAIRLLQLSTLELNQEIDLLMQTNPLLERGDDHEDEYGNAVDDPVQEAGAAVAEGAQAEFASASQDDSLDASKDNFQIATSETNTSETAAAESSQFEELQEFDPNRAEFSDSFNADFDEEFDVFSNGSRWDENNAPADDDSDFKQQETLQVSLREHLLSQLKLMPLSERDQSIIALLVDSINEDGYLEQSLEQIAAEMPDELEMDVLELQTALRHIQHLDPAGVGSRNLSECLLLQ
ncbi:MAG: RNA polymerase factor sigma-54, partial [Methylophilales bacterium 16-45-9]